MIHVLKQNHPLYSRLKALRSATATITATTATTAHRSRILQVYLPTHDIPDGGYTVTKPTTGTIKLKTKSSLSYDTGALIPGPDWQTDTLRLDTSIAPIIDQIAQLTGAIYPAEALLYPLLSQRGQDVTICYRSGSEHVILMAPSMTIALTPTVKRLITGIPAALDAKIRALAANRGTSINRVILDQLNLFTTM